MALWTEVDFHHEVAAASLAYQFGFPLLPVIVQFAFLAKFALIWRFLQMVAVLIFVRQPLLFLQPLDLFLALPHFFLRQQIQDLHRGLVGLDLKGAGYINQHVVQGIDGQAGVPFDFLQKMGIFNLKVVGNLNKLVHSVRTFSSPQ